MHFFRFLGGSGLKYMENLKAATPKVGETPIKERRKDEKPVSYRFFVSFVSVTWQKTIKFGEITTPL